MLEEKEVLRERLRERRRALSSDERIILSDIICDHLSNIISDNETVMVYCPKDPEVNTCRFIDHLLREKIPVTVPIIQKEDTSLRLSYIRTRSDLVISTFCVPEPIGHEIPADPDDITTAIIPILGFDRSGGRLGYGAGYYDRFLSEYPHIRKIGVAFGCQETEMIPTDTNDIRMDIVITEDGVIYRGR